MRDASHFNALQEPCRLPEEGTNSHCAVRRSTRERSVPHVTEKHERSQDWTNVETCAMLFCVSFVL